MIDNPVRPNYSTKKHELKLFTDDVIMKRCLARALYTPGFTIGIYCDSIAIMASTAIQAKRLYDDVPIWVKCGVTHWNRSTIAFENGSRIFFISDPKGACGLELNYICIWDGIKNFDDTFWELVSRIRPLKTAPPQLNWTVKGQDQIERFS